MNMDISSLEAFAFLSTHTILLSKQHNPVFIS